MFDPTLKDVCLAFFTGGGLAAVFGIIQYKIKRADDERDSANDIKKLTKELVEWKDYQSGVTQKQSEMLMGLAHDRIVRLGSSYIEAGEVTMQELDDFNCYLYEPYAKLGGNGTGEMIWRRVNELPVRH